MPKQKPTAQILVSDGAGGMRPVTDLRFEGSEWPIDFSIRAGDAEAWMAHLNAEAEERGWSSSGMSQLNAEENSGTLSISTAIGQTPPVVDIIWERPRGRELRLRVRPSSDPPLSLEATRGFIDAVSARQKAGLLNRQHGRTFLTYDGLPWRGELWLDSDHRLGPPSLHPDTLLGPQIVVTELMVEGIGRHGVSANFQVRVQELRVFLGFVLGLNLGISKVARGWICSFDEHRVATCSLGNVGYVEANQVSGFPPVGSAPPIDRRAVTRPGLGPFGIYPDMREEWVPADIESLWAAFRSLSKAKRDHLLRAANAFMNAQAMWPDQRTAYATFLVVACEALKPHGKRHKGMNIYDVIASLVSREEAAHFRAMSVHPQNVRNRHLHHGELVAGELIPIMMTDYFKDPSFDRMLTALSRITRVCLIEWLRCNGEYNAVFVRRETSIVDRLIAIWTGIFRVR